ncbi:MULTISPECIES: hypothetical protein [Bartonella]|uniref:hypothetical protein n=1 Tax=Bartonella TaxID=773 RepID=UPI0018DB8CAD|nr:MULTISPECIES: hypothetical protein [Bartonella]MBH9976020.1 hypothetical protein [Bartonella choladocola]MBI0015639.1 hypothetical protein [Bartonella sp. B10834G3]
MPSNLDIDKQNDNSQKKSEAEKKFKIIKKRILLCGIICLLTAISVYAIAYFFYPFDSLTIRLIIFVSIVLADMSLWFYSMMTMDTNRVLFVSLSIALFGLFLVSTFYPYQGLQKNLNIIAVVVLSAAVLFVLLFIFINESFFSSKSPDIRQSVDFVSNRFAVIVLTVTLILGTLFGTIAFLGFYPDKDNSTFFGGIDIKNVALATAGLVTFFWAAKATKIKSIELEEKKQDGKRHDNEIKMAKQRDTAQLIAEASKLLSSENDAQKYAGLSFLNAVASDPKGPLRKEAFDILTDFIINASDVTTANEVRMRAIHYADDLVGNNSDELFSNEYIYISNAHSELNYFTPIKTKNLYVVYIGFKIDESSLLENVQLRKTNQFAFIECFFNGLKYDRNTVEIDNISVWKCTLKYCKIKSANPSRLIPLQDPSAESSWIIDYVPEKYSDNGVSNFNSFEKCDFSDCLSWLPIKGCLTVENGMKEAFDRSYYYTGHEPLGFDKEQDGALLIEITSKEQFEELFKEERLPYSPPHDKK